MIENYSIKVLFNYLKQKNHPVVVFKKSKKRDTS